jgi:hypothetical protein
MSAFRFLPGSFLRRIENLKSAHTHQQLRRQRFAPRNHLEYSWFWRLDGVSGAEFREERRAEENFA